VDRNTYNNIWQYISQNVKWILEIWKSVGVAGSNVPLGWRVSIRSAQVLGISSIYTDLVAPVVAGPYLRFPFKMMVLWFTSGSPVLLIRSTCRLYKQRQTTEGIPTRDKECRCVSISEEIMCGSCDNNQLLRF